MKALFIIFLVYFLHLEKAKGHQSSKESDLDWANNVFQETNNGAVVPKNVELKNIKATRKQKRGKRMRQIQKQKSQKDKRKREKKVRRRDKKGAKTRKSNQIRENMKNKNIKRDNKKKNKKDKKNKNKRKNKKKQRISGKTWNKNRKQNNSNKKNKRLKIEKIRKMRKQMRKENKKKYMKRQKNKNKQRTHQQEREFFGPNGDNSETGPNKRSVQEFSCDIFGYTRDFSVALTQINRVNRILKKPTRMRDLAMTDFNDAIAALGAATRGGKLCYGSDTSYNNDMSRLIYDHLQFCKNDVPSICDTTKIAGYDSAAIDNATNCKGRLERFVKFYRSSIFKDHGAQYENVCLNLGVSWENQSDPKVSLDNANAKDSSGKKIKSPDTPLELWRDHCLPSTSKTLDKAVKARFDVCMDPLGLVPGSFGSCMTFLQESMLYIDICNPYPAMFGTITSFYTWVKDQSQLLDQFLQNIQQLNPFNATHRIYERQADSTPNTTSNPSPWQVGPDLNFGTVINMMSGTNCTNTKEYEILINCNVSIPDICNAKPLYVKWEELNGHICKKMIEDFTTDYELIINNIPVRSGISKVSGDRQDNLNSSISGYNLPLIEKCIPKFCYSEECSLGQQNHKLTSFTELKTQFFISFEFKSSAGNKPAAPTAGPTAPAAGPTVGQNRQLTTPTAPAAGPTAPAAGPTAPAAGPTGPAAAHTALAAAPTLQNVIKLMESNKNPVLSLSINHTDANLIICSHTFDDKGNCKSVQNAITADKWHHVEFSQVLENDISTFQVKIDGSKTVNVETEIPKTFSNVDVFTRVDTLDEAPMGSLRNMFINTKITAENQCKVELELARASSVSGVDYEADFAIDGKNSTSNKDYFLSKLEDYPWLEVKLADPTNVTGVTIMNIRYGFPYWFRKAVIRAGPNKIEAGSRGELLTNNPVCGTYQGPAAIGATINIECASPVMADYVSVQLNYTNALLGVDEIIVNPQVSMGNNYAFLNELRENITKANCLSDEYSALVANVAATVSTCSNATVKGSYGSCDAARSTAYEFINSCARPTTPAPSTTTGTFITLRSKRRRQLFYKEKFLTKNIKNKL